MSRKHENVPYKLTTVYHPTPSGGLHCNLLFHWDLAVLVGMKGNTDVSKIKHIVQYCVTHEENK